MNDNSQAKPDKPSSPAINFLITFLAVTLTVFSILRAWDIDRMIGLVLYTEQFLGIMLALAMPLTYLAVPALKKGQRVGKVPWYDILFALFGFASAAYITVRYPALTDLVTVRPWDGLIGGAIMLILITEALRRTTGWVLTILVIVFFLYTLVSDLVPGVLQGRPVALSKLVYYLSWDNSAVLGTPMRIVTSIVVAFVLFGQILFKSGGSAFFTEFATVLMGRFRGGPAKISVFASSLFGSISGSTVSNVVTTGVVTIPLMTKGGYRPHLAGAIEAVASTGGQLMPPVMGAAAFLMAEFLSISYTEVVLAALIPSILYYFALFIEADLEAARSGILRVPQDQIPPAGDVLKSGWFFPLPFIILIIALFWWNDLPEKAALRAVIVIVLAVTIFGYKGKRLTLLELFHCLRTTGLNVLGIFMISAAAGIVIGVLNISGVGFALTLALVQIAGHNLAVLLILAAVVCIILGMGMPTIGVYVLLATLVAPALVEVGVVPIAAHLFILYFGMLSFITPPVAIGAFAAATLSGASPMRTGFAAMRFGWLAFVIPFMFVLSPTLLMQGRPAMIVINLASAMCGVWIVSMGIIGFLVRRLGPFLRIILGLSGLALISPASGHGAGISVNIIGFVIGGTLVFREILWLKRSRTAEGA
ncbi:MAG: TRAP transporter fused permease subunit [Pseudomonadota bacterium]